jgi:hypothetical protein
MGYTHYFYQSKRFSNPQWQQIVEDIKQIVDYCVEEKRIPLQYEYNVSREPSITDRQIRFNGVEEDGHETFFLTKVMPAKREWEKKEGPKFLFCKTALKPYDLAVCLSLLRILKIAPDVIKVLSDGDWENDWKEARTCYQELFGEESPMISKEE